MFEDLGLPSDGCITKCQICGGNLTPSFLDPELKRLMKGCLKCGSKIDVTDDWNKNNKHSTHKGCGGGMVSFLDPSTFILMGSCLKCGFKINMEEAKEVPIESPEK